MGRGLDSMGHLGAAPPIVNEVLSSPGKALDPVDRQAMATRLHHDFSKVRVHADSRAAESAKAVDAMAYTVGSHVVFDDGKYEPRTSQGRQLLAHELIHAVQQSHGSGGGTIALGDPSDHSERQAERMASAGFEQRRVAVDSSRSFRVQRQMNQPQRSSSDLPESASPFLAGAIGPITIDGFETGRADISQINQTALRKAAATIQTLLKKYPGSGIHVTGHTDAVGKETDNQTLGQARAESVRTALAGLGIPAEAIATESKGEAQLLVKTERAEARNRRVEVRFEPHTTPALHPLPDQPSTPPSFGGGYKVDLNLPPNLRLRTTAPDIAPANAPQTQTPPSPGKKETPPAVGEIKALMELIKKTADATKRDPLVRKLRDALAELQPFMPAGDAKKEIDKAIDSLVKVGTEAGIMAILQAVAGGSPLPVTEKRDQTGPYVPQKDLGQHIFPGLKLPIPDTPRPAPKSSFQYRNGPQKSYAAGATIKFTLIAPDNFSSLQGEKRLVIVAEADRDVPNPDRLGTVPLESVSPKSIEMSAPQTPGKYLFRVDIGLGFDYSSVQEFEVTEPEKK